MAIWFSHIGVHLAPLGERLFEDRASDADDSDRLTSSLSVRDRGFGGVEPPIVIYRFGDGRSDERLERHFTR